MHSFHRLPAASFIGLMLLGLALWSCATPTPPAPTATVAPPPTATRTPISNHQWLLVDVPPGSTQLVYGAEAYRLVCQDCHGDRGQGLTDEWRATWAPADQNCWQAKCHSESHPVDGFKLPVAPPIVGRAVLARYESANDLYDLIQNEMPWYNPGSLTEKDAWAVTAYVLKLNGMNPGPMLDVGTASLIKLK